MLNYSLLDDKDLMKAIQAGDRTAFNELYNRYVNELLVFIDSKVQDLEESKDIIQEIFVYIWDDRQNIVEINSISNYLYRIAVNKSLNLFRRQKISQNYIDSLAYFLKYNTSTHEQDNFEFQREQELLHAVSTLPAGMRTIFELRYYEGLSNEDVAKRLSLSTHTVATQMKRALKSIRSQLHIVAFLYLIMQL